MSDEPHVQIRQMPPQIRETQPPATHEARTVEDFWADVWERPWLGFAITAIVPGIVLSLLGPFGSFGAPLWARFAYWMPTMALGATIGATLTIWSDRTELFRRRPIAKVLTLTTLMTGAMSGVAWGMGWVVFGPGAISFSPVFIFYVWVITVLVTMISAIIRARRVSVAAAPVPAAVPVTPPSLVARLPDRLKAGAVLALQGEDHYVRVHTTAGSDLVLARLGDAIGEMGSTPGARTHRSWWVAKGAVKRTQRGNGKVSLVLSNDLEVPVSRGYASELRDAGWLAD